MGGSASFNTAFKVALDVDMPVSQNTEISGAALRGFYDLHLGVAVA